ncbi:MAG: ribulose-phosphate 3-epimerase [Duncaniella sp.]|nr:ribulose-phosphate 3-epimerase [Duncaniella sp.]MDE5751332.1 ribulose-phosphate 3-epimerase [Duncaniella sp.]MDE5918173.1 ribulose-phosphate 3-epimerase [Duncaniella sp.]MDE6327917.1 ribulose-phosphate 3-epimerase [Duncaniella sp.]MDE6465344.1 ribulose-phosphate 3-epimerase [Duncaniella sp.]
MIQVAPSLLAADFARLGEAVEIVNRSDASLIHIDVMDGVFVPNITIGFPVISAINTIARKPLDVHMMITDPGRYVGQVRDAGAHIMNVHWEACTHLDRVVHTIRQAGMKAGVTVNPATPVEFLGDIISELDLVLVMSVNPGFGGQKFIPNTISKVKRLREMIAASGSQAVIEVDGGVDLSTAPSLIAAGADVLVAGSYVFRAPDPVKAVADLIKLSEA